MKNTNGSFSSIDNNLLVDVSGGCGRRRCHRRCGGGGNTVINNYGAAPAAPAAPAPSGGNTSVQVSAGYSQ